MKIKIAAAMLLATVSINSNAGVFTYMAASDAASAASRAEQASKSRSTAVTTGPNSVMCNYDNGFCVADERNTVQRLEKWYGLTYFGGVKCSPEQYVTATIGRKINRVVAITYVYLGSTKAVIEYE